MKLIFVLSVVCFTDPVFFLLLIILIGGYLDVAPDAE